MIFGLKNVNFDHSHIGASSIKNILILGLILLSMARKMSKYVAKNKLWPIWCLFGYLCCLNHLRVKLTHARVITSFQTLPEIGLNISKPKTSNQWLATLFRSISKEEAPQLLSAWRRNVKMLILDGSCWRFSNEILSCYLLPRSYSCCECAWIERCYRVKNA